MGDLDRSVADANRAIEIDSKFAGGYYVRARAYSAKGDFEAALADYNQAIELNPKFKTSYLARADLYKTRGDFEHALADYDQAIQIDPNDGWAFRARAIAKFQDGLLSKSLDDLNKSNALNPKDAYAVLWLDIVSKRSNLPSRLAQLSAGLDMTKWPAPLVRLFEGGITSEAVFAAADDVNAWKKKGQVCEANFFTGELALQRGASEEAARLFRLAVRDCPKIFLESSAAGFELKAMGATP
jgi:lipoprotein NlpI